MLCFRMEKWGHLKSTFDEIVPCCHPLSTKWTHFQNFLDQNDLNLPQMYVAYHAKRALSSNPQPHKVLYPDQGRGQPLLKHSRSNIVRGQLFLEAKAALVFSTHWEWPNGEDAPPLCCRPNLLAATRESEELAWVPRGRQVQCARRPAQRQVDSGYGPASLSAGAWARTRVS